MKREIYTTIILIFFTVLAFAQAHKISGVVNDDETGIPISYVLVTIEGDDANTITDEEGKFSIDAAIGDKMIISHLGFEDFVFTITGEKEINVKMISAPIVIEDIFVTGINTSQSNIAVNETNAISRPRNVADLFKDVGGFNLTKRSNYSIDPVFRSFKYEQLNIQYDGGIKAMNACPNRMDPVTTHVMPEEIEKIEIIRGPFSVRFGNNFGGVVNLKTHSPFRESGTGFHGNIRTGYEMNGGSFLGMATLGYVKEKYDFVVSGGMRDYGNYTDGSGVEVPSSFKSYDYSMKMSVKPKKNQLAQITWRQSFARDVLHAGLPMDNSTDDSYIVAADYKIKNISPKIYSVSFKGFYSYVDHVMDNFSRKNFKIVEAKTPVQAKTLGGKIEMVLTPSKNLNLYTGVDLNNIGRTGNRERIVKIAVKPDTMIVLDAPKEFVDSVWQDCVINDFGMFFESHFKTGVKTGINAGGRFDFVNAQVNEPAYEFSKVYNDFEKVNESNFSGFVSFQYTPVNGTNIELAIGRGVRTASETERYINHLSVGSDPYELFGNPLLKPEKNNQIEFSISHYAKGFHAGANLFYSLIDDYITAVVDTTIGRKFLPWIQPVYARRFQNIEKATQKGFEIYAQVKFLDGFSAKGEVSYTVANNEDWDEPLPMIPPMQTFITLKYEHSKFWGNLQGRFVAKQSNFSKSFGESETPGFMTLDFKAGIKPVEGMTVGFAVLNILDEAYYEHLSWKYKNQETGLSGRFLEQGRNITVYAKYKF